MKLAAILVFGALISPEPLTRMTSWSYLFVFLVLVLVRPVALGIALLGSELSRRERIVAAWFGPRGFASVVFGLLILKINLENSDVLFILAAMVISGSIIAHSSTDVLLRVGCNPPRTTRTSNRTTKNRLIMRKANPRKSLPPFPCREPMAASHVNSPFPPRQEFSCDI